MLPFLLNVLIFTLILGQFGNIGKNEGFNLYVFDVLAFIIAVLGLTKFFILRKFNLPKHLALFIPFLIIALISLIYNLPNLSIVEFLISSSYLIRLAIYFAIALVVYNLVINKMLLSKSLERSLILSGVLLGLVGLVQLVVLPDFTQLDPSLGWDPHQNRLASSFFDPNFTGAYLAIIFALVLNRILCEKKTALGLLALVFLLLCIILTFSRSAWLLTAMIIFIYGLMKNRLLLFSAVFIMFMAYFAVPRIQTRISGITDPSDSAHLRFESWKNASLIANDHLWTGIGFNTYRYVQREYGYLNGDTFYDHSGSGADSSLLFVLVTTGILGLLTYTIWWVSPVFEYLFFKVNKDILLISVIIGLSVESTFINALFYPQILFVVLMFFVRNSVSRISR